MGRKSLVLLLSVIVFVFSACEKGAADTAKPSNVKPTRAAAPPIPTPSIPKDGNYRGRA